RILIMHASIVQQQADMVGRYPDQGSLKPLLGPADHARRIQVEEIVAKVGLHGAETAVVSAQWATDAGPIEAAVAITAGFAGKEIADLGIAAEEIRAGGAGGRQIGVQPVRFGGGV